MMESSVGSYQNAFDKYLTKKIIGQARLRKPTKRWYVLTRTVLLLPRMASFIEQAANQLIVDVFSS